MRRWYVVHRAGRFVSPATAAFVEFVVEAAPGLLAELHPPARGRPGEPRAARIPGHPRATLTQCGVMVKLPALLTAMSAFTKATL